VEEPVDHKASFKVNGRSAGPGGPRHIGQEAYTTRRRAAETSSGGPTPWPLPPLRGG